MGRRNSKAREVALPRPLHIRQPSDRGHFNEDGTRKQAYRSLADAENARRAIPDGHLLEAYPCAWKNCRAYHLGHSEDPSHQESYWGS